MLFCGVIGLERARQAGDAAPQTETAAGLLLRKYHIQSLGGFKRSAAPDGSAKIDNSLN